MGRKQNLSAVIELVLIFKSGLYIMYIMRVDSNKTTAHIILIIIYAAFAVRAVVTPFLSIAYPEIEKKDLS